MLSESFGNEYARKLYGYGLDKHTFNRSQLTIKKIGFNFRTGENK